MYETNLAVSPFEDGKYTSKILSYQADIGPATNNDSTVSKASYAVTSNGAVEVVYSNGDTITVEDNKGNIVVFESLEHILERSLNCFKIFCIIWNSTIIKSWRQD